MDTYLDIFKNSLNNLDSDQLIEILPFLVNELYSRLDEEEVIELLRQVID